METGYIYAIKNTENNKFYIGQTTNTPEERFKMHMKKSTLKARSNLKLYTAVLEIGKDRFYVETLEKDVPIEKLDEREMFYIEKYNSCDNGYNATKGGKGGLALSVSEQKEVLKHARQGTNANDLADMYGVNKATIFRTLHSMGFYYNEIDLEKLQSMVEQRKTNSEIADELNVDIGSVSRILDRYNMRKNRKPVKCRGNFDFASLKADCESKVPIDEICSKYNISRTTFYRIKESLGIKSAWN